ncbi:Complement component C9 [Folsomia candida]|uniref:Complement component C9 n=2 Tax=Folsomia candida TaxID=158441 RepID=A0A226DEF3_FOLCA|nr:Complement component C9 [Folsomia candida]
MLSIFLSYYLQNQLPSPPLERNQTFNESLELDTCANPIPGISRILLGVDVTKLDLRHDYSVDHVDGFTTKLLDITCKEGGTWTSPFSGVKYDVPDQVLQVVALPSGLVASDTLLHTNMESVRHSMSEEAGISSVKEGLFSASLSFKNSQTSLFNSSRFVATMKAFVSTAGIDFIPPTDLGTSLNKYFVDALQALPVTYEEHPEAYDSFISTYGTHYYASGYFGGSLSTYFEVDKSFRRLTSDNEVKANAEATFFGILKTHGAYDGNVSTISEEFKRASHNSQRYYGGVANLFEKDGYTKWWPTVEGNSWLYGGVLKPVSELVPIGKQREALSKAVNVYISKAYLREVKRTGDSFMGRGLVGEEVVAGYLNRVEALLESVNFTDAEVLQVGREISDYVLTPEWFTNVVYTVIWTDPAKGFTLVHSAKMLSATPIFDMCDGERIEMDCYRKDDISFTSPPGSPSWWASVSVSNNYGVQGWTNSWVFNIPANSGLVEQCEVLLLSGWGCTLRGG